MPIAQLSRALLLAMVTSLLGLAQTSGCAAGQGTAVCVVMCDGGLPGYDGPSSPPDGPTPDVPGGADGFPSGDLPGGDVPVFPDAPMVISPDMPPLATCGNGTIEPGEECDDHNTTSGDGCSAQCKREVPCADGTLRPDTGACYVVVPTAATWADAERDCQQRGGHLVSITDGTAAALVQSLVGNNTVWIGLFLNGGAPGVGAFRWLDGKAAPAGEAGWASGKPDNGSGDERCGAMTAAGWDDNACLTALPYICQLTCGNGVVDPGEDCDDGNRQSGDGCTQACHHEAPCNAPDLADPVSGHCYETVSTLRNWPDAQADCMRGGAHLVTPQNAAEEALVEGLLAQQLPGVDTWNGLTNASMAAPPDYEWVSGEPVTWTDWDSGEPNNPGVENCGIILKAVRHAGFGRWDNRACTATLGYVCEHDSP
jgi:cysteine-rich repeat protein